MNTKCQHMNFAANVNVIRLEDSGRFMTEIRVKCADCGTPFKFLGLPMGLNLGGATVTLDGVEANIAVCPVGEEPPEPKGLMGYNIAGLSE